MGATTGDKKSGLALAYIDARDVQDRLDEICGPEGWQCSYPHANGKTVCSIGIKMGDEWIWKANGAGDTDVEAEKGALSDAFKRAAVMWGIGRYLYDVKSVWVEIEPAGKSFKIKESEYGKLRALLAKDAQAHAKPEAAPAHEHEQRQRQTWAQWVAAAEQAVLGFRDPNDVSLWLSDNFERLEALAKRDKAIWNTLQTKIKNHKDDLERRAA